MLIGWCRPDALSTGTIAAFEAALDSEERERALRFVLARDRHAFVAAHGALRFALSRLAPRTPQAWLFDRDRNGRPEVASAQQPAPAFSLSHTRGLVACAVTLSGSIGIDAEEILASEPDEGLLAAACTPGERDGIRSLPHAERAAAFTHLWTRKEASAKALGQAHAFRPERPIAPELARSLTCTTFCPTVQHAVSVAFTPAAGAMPKPEICEIADGWVTYGPTSRDT